MRAIQWIMALAILVSCANEANQSAAPTKLVADTPSAATATVALATATTEIVPSATNQIEPSATVVSVTETATTAPTVAMTSTPADPLVVDTTPRQPIVGGPTLLDNRLNLRRVATMPVNSIRVVYDQTTAQLLLLNMTEGLMAIDPQTGQMRTIADATIIAPNGMPSGLAVAANGTILVVSNLQANGYNTATIRRGTPNGSSYTWTTLATTEQYPLSGTNFDHVFNGITITPDQQYVIVNSGSRTDHGEVEDNQGLFPGMREVPLTARLFRIPINASYITLPNDEAALAPYVYARGFRNAYDPAFAPTGELFVGDNGPDADLPDEFNLVREGGHYGFPWRFGNIDTPQRNPNYDPSQDRLLNDEFVAVQLGIYANDPDYPTAPENMIDPIVNRGPAATVYRTMDGQIADASALGQTLSSFTPHRSPLGLTFASAAFPASWQVPGGISGFILSWGAAGGDIPDKGQDLLHLQLAATASGGYDMRSVQLIRDLRNPIDATLIDNRMYILEFGADVALWEVEFLP
ncbi:MAG: PQQ-dependent sugar dehydrogenase [Roseiflexaceae bacterium]